MPEARQQEEAKARAEAEARAKAEEERLKAEAALAAKQQEEAKAIAAAEALAKAEAERLLKEQKEKEAAERKAKELAIAKAKADEELLKAEQQRQESERKAREAAAREKAALAQRNPQSKDAAQTNKQLSESDIREAIELNRRLMADNEELRTQLQMMNAKLDFLLAQMKKQDEAIELPVESYTEEAATALNEGKRLILQNMLFDYNKARLRGSSERELDKLAEFLLAHKDIKLTVSGHTDAIGDPGYNLRLSRARAEAVVSYLVSKGVSASRLKSVGYGQTRPIARNISADGQDNPLGRQMNRRIEISVTEGDADLIQVREEVISEELLPNR